jgi:hypothetical protein
MSEEGLGEGRGGWERRGSGRQEGTKIAYGLHFRIFVEFYYDFGDNFRSSIFEIKF